MDNKHYTYKMMITVTGLLLFIYVNATNYTVSTKANLVSKMIAALPGDTVIVANGIYSWDLISFVNPHGSQLAAPIVLKAQSFKGVVFSGNSRFEFQVTNMLMTGFVFMNGNPISSAVIKMGKSTTQGSNYCRITNIIIDSYNSDSSTVSGVTAEWIGIYGVHNRIDHCTFINKCYGDPVVVVWYDNNTFPQKSTSTYHLIDSNYFRHISYQGSNGGETIRVGTGANCNSDGYNIVEYNLFEDGVQIDPEIISNKSCYNTYRYNTFRNTAGGITLRRGRYCSAYGNFFLRDASSNNSRQYGFRIFEKGHKVFNNYIEGVNSNQGTFSTTLCPINIENGEVPIGDTINPASQSLHFPADSCIVAFNTIVNAFGGQGIAIGFVAGGSYPYQPQGVIIANNIINMAQGVAVYNSSTNTSLTYFAEGNLYQAPGGLAPSGTIIPTSGFTNNSLLFGARINGVLLPPTLVQDAAMNTADYASMLNAKDLCLTTRSSVYDVGCYELNGTGVVVNQPLDSNIVGAGKPVKILPLKLENFTVLLMNKLVSITWQVIDEINLNEYNVEWSSDAMHFKSIGIVNVNASKLYYFQHSIPVEGKNYYRLKMINKDGSYQYSPVQTIIVNNYITVNVYPNPARSFVTVDLYGALNPSTEITLSDASGRIVNRMNVISNRVYIDLRNSITGMYLLQITEKNKQIINYPFTISK